MGIFKLSLKIIGQISFVIIFFSTLEAKNIDKFEKGNNISDYFSGILHLNSNQYDESYKFLISKPEKHPVDEGSFEDLRF